MIDCDRLLLAQALSSQGQTAEAEAIYHEILSQRPDAVEALTGLGALAYQSGRVEQASAMFARGLAFRPDVAELHANLGESLRLLRQSDRALAHLQKALALERNLPVAWNSLGLLLHDFRRYSEAEAAYREAIHRRPDFNAALINLGMTLEALGRRDEAITALRAAVEREPDNAAALTNLGKLLVEREDPALLDEAEVLCRRAVANSPKLVPAINNLGNVLKLQGRPVEAMACYRKAAEIAPSGGRARWNIGQLLVQQGCFEEALLAFEEAQLRSPDPEAYHLSLGGLWAMRCNHVAAANHYRLALEFNPGLAGAYHGLGVALLELGRLDEAQAALHSALTIAPTRASTLTALARIKRERGDIQGSCDLARKALAMHPNHADAYCELVADLRGRLTDGDLSEMERVAALKFVTDETRALLLFALACVHDARGQYDSAARYLAAANPLQSSVRKTRGVSYDPDEYSELTDRLIAIFTPGYLASRTGWGQPDPRPVFVVGLPRTGSSLVEQILASHHLIHGAGELNCLQDLFHELREVLCLDSTDRLNPGDQLTADLSRAAARRYLAALETVAPPSAVRVIDKMPENMTVVGLIQLLLPAARVIVCRRDPRDVALSCWQTPFATVPWANHVEHIARRMADHRRLLYHWRRVATIDLLEIVYEDLVADLEGTARRLVEFVGLEWDPRCVDFHTSRRVVRTASSVQVRKPIYRSSVGRWRAYESSLESLWLALERHGITGPETTPPAHDDRCEGR